MEDCGFFWVAVSSHWKRVCGDLLSLRYFCSFGGLSTACLFPVKSPWKVFSLVPQAVFFCAPKPLPSSSDLVVLQMNLELQIHFLEFHRLHT